MLPRVISLVPSLTEALLDWGLAERLVGRTRYCIEPAAQVDRVETVGGTKNPNVARIIELAPDVVVVNKEENRIEDCQLLLEAGLSLHVTHPRCVAEAATMFEELGPAVGCPEQGLALAAAIRNELVGSARAVVAPLRVFCPIWFKPWMTFRNATYIGSVLTEVGFSNGFGDREEPDFFEISIDEILAADLELILLPDEPFVFTQRHREILSDAGVTAPVVLCDGQDLAWYGPRTPAALRRLRTLRASSCA